MELDLRPEDFEVQKLTPGNIISIFPNKDPYEAIEDLLKGIYTMDHLDKLLVEWDETIKNAEQPEYLIMAFAELKRAIESIKKESEKKSIAFMEKMFKP